MAQDENNAFEEDELGDLDFDDMGPSFDFDNMESDVGGRKPAGPAKVAIASSIKGFGKGVSEQLKTEIGREMPKTVSLIEDASAGINAVKDIKSQFSQEITPTKTALKQLSNKLLPN